jgi:hypothetical protein
MCHFPLITAGNDKDEHHHHAPVTLQYCRKTNKLIKREDDGKITVAVQQPQQ